MENGLPSTDPFSYAFPDRPWIEPRWLYCVTIHGLSSLGLNLLILFKAALLAAAFAVLSLSGDRRRPWAIWFGATLALSVAAERFLVRPELISFFGLARE